MVIDRSGHKLLHPSQILYHKESESESVQEETFFEEKEEEESAIDTIDVSPFSSPTADPHGNLLSNLFLVPFHILLMLFHVTT